MPCSMTNRLHDQLIDSVTDYYLCFYICYVVLCITKAEFTERYMQILTASMTHAESVSHNTYNSYTIDIFVWCYKASVICFYGNVSLTWVMVLQALLSNNLHAPGNVKLTPLLMELQIVLHKHCLACTEHKAVVDGPVGQVLVGPPFVKAKTKFHFTESKQLINKSTRVMFGLVQLVILWCSSLR